MLTPRVREDAGSFVDGSSLCLSVDNYPAITAITALLQLLHFFISSFLHLRILHLKIQKRAKYL